MGWDCVVGIATRYGLKGPGIESADTSGRAVWGDGLRPIAFWGCEFESRRGHGWLYCVLQGKTKGKMQDSQDKRTSYGWSIEYKRIQTNPCGGEIFRTLLDLPWGPPSFLYNGYRVSFPGVKRPGHGVNHPPSSSAQFKERSQLYLCSLSVPTYSVLGWPLPYH